MPATPAIFMKQFFILLLCGLSLILLQTIPWHHMVPQVFRLNLSFALVIFLALYRPSASSWLLVFLLGGVMDVLSGVPSGLLPLTNLLTFFLIRATCRYVAFESLFSQAVLVFALSCLLNLSLLIATKVALLCPFGMLLGGVLVQGFSLMVLSIPLFAILNKKLGGRELALKGP